MLDLIIGASNQIEQQVNFDTERHRLPRSPASSGTPSAHLRQRIQYTATCATPAAGSTATPRGSAPAARPLRSMTRSAWAAAAMAINIQPAPAAPDPLLRGWQKAMTRTAAATQRKPIGRLCMLQSRLFFALMDAAPDPQGLQHRSTTSRVLLASIGVCSSC